ncbi:MAG: hypothetical protein KIS86_16680 [Devosia sp.]|nr:hypothetical protein [Devosia sp.]
MPAILTIQDLIDNQMGMSVHCNVIGCGHSADLDLHALGTKLGFGFVTVGDPNPLVARLRCSKCGSKDLGLILSSRSGYKGPSAPVSGQGIAKASDIPVNSRKSRRRQRLM